MLRAAPDKTVTCKEFALEYLYHKVASRCSDLRGEGYDIRYIKGDTVMEGKYILVSELDENGQRIFC
jgi:hypothetical protein